MKRIMVTLDDEQYKILKSLKGFGTKDAEKLRNIFVAYLSEKSYLKKEFDSSGKEREKGFPSLPAEFVEWYKEKGKPVRNIDDLDLSDLVEKFKEWKKQHKET